MCELVTKPRNSVGVGCAYPSAAEVAGAGVRYCPCQRHIRFSGLDFKRWLNRNYCSVECLIRFTPDRQISGLVAGGVSMDALGFALGFSCQSIAKVLSIE